MTWALLPLYLLDATKGGGAIFVSDDFWRKARRRTPEVYRPRKRETGEGLEMWLGTGLSAQGKSFLAGVEAARKAADKLGAKTPVLGLCFVAGEGYQIKNVLEGVKQVLGCPVVGAEVVSGYMFCDEGFSGRGVMVGALALPDGKVALGLGKGFMGQTDRAVEEALEPLRAESQNWDLVFILAPHAFPLAGEVLARELARAGEGMGAILGAIVGPVGDPEPTRLIWEDKTYSDHVIAVGIRTGANAGLGLGHGFHPVAPFKVTHAQGNVVKELDGSPVHIILKEFLEKRGSSPEADDLLLRYQVAVAHPENPGQFRAILALGITKAGLITNAEIPVGASLWFMEASPEEMLEASEKGSQAAVRNAGSKRLLGALVLESALRPMVLSEEDFVKEKDIITRNLGVPYLGIPTAEEMVAGPGVFPGAHSGSLAFGVLAGGEEGP